KDALSVRRPSPGIISASASGKDVDTVRNHEGRIEPAAELSNERSALPALRHLDFFQKSSCTRMGNGSEGFDHLVPVHPNSIVLNGEALLVGIERHRDTQGRIICQEVRLCDRLVAQPLASIGCIRNQLAQEDVFFGIDSVEHQVQELGYIGRKCAALGFSDVTGCHSSKVPLAPLSPTEWKTAFAPARSFFCEAGR